MSGLTSGLNMPATDTVKTLYCHFIAVAFRLKQVERSA